MSAGPSTAWPLFRLRLETARLELRPVQDSDLDELVAVALAGIHDPADTPFIRPWTDVPADELPAAVCRYFWQQRASWAPVAWRLPLAVRERTTGRLVGVQQLQADAFAATGAVDTSSWLGREHQGAGLGTEMRAAVLDLAFAGLGAQLARSTAFAQNQGSIRVSQKLGYARNGEDVLAVRGRPVVNLRFVLPRAAWEGREPVARIDGLAGLEPLFGAAGR